MAEGNFKSGIIEIRDILCIHKERGISELSLFRVMVSTNNMLEVFYLSLAVRRSCGKSV